MVADADRDQAAFDGAGAGRVELVDDPGPHAIERVGVGRGGGAVPTGGGRGGGAVPLAPAAAREQPSARVARDQVRLERIGGDGVDGAVGVPRERAGVGVPAGHASASLIWCRARSIRVFTVPCGMPSRRAASFVVRPSSTVARITARSSGDRAFIARAELAVLDPEEHLVLGGHEHVVVGPA